MEFQPPAVYTAKLLEKLQHNEKFIQFRFELTEPHRMNFLAGQYVSVKVADRGDRRSYSICSSPEIDHSFELLIDVTPQGKGCQYLCSLQDGEAIEALGPMGRFVVPSDVATTSAESALQFVATGSGIAPIRSMILDQLQVKQDQRPITLYWGMRHEQDLFWVQEFEELVRSFPNFEFHPLLSQPTDIWTLCRGRVTDCIKTHARPENAGYYLCGSESMLKDMRQLLQSMAIAPERVHFESFY